MNVTRFEDVPVLLPGDSSPDLILKKLQRFVEEKHDVKFDDFWSFHKWSIDQLQDYWGDLWEFSGIISAKKYNEVLDPSLPINETSAWFKGALVNYAENLLKYRDDREAIVTASEESDIQSITYSQLFKQVELYAAAFRKWGLKKGDIVACYMSNRVEPVFAMIASASIGAIFTGTLPLLGPEAVLSRISLVKPKFLITVDRYLYEGEEIEMLPKVKAIAEALLFEKVIVVPSRGKSNLPDISGIRNSCFLDSFLEVGRRRDGGEGGKGGLPPPPPITFEHVPPSHPVFICFTSGTSGDPKPILHGFGVGWVTWNIINSMLFMGCRTVLFESSPNYLSKTFFWDFIDKTQVSHLLVSASNMDQFSKRGILPTEKHSLKSLKCFLTGGSVVNPESYDFYYGKVGRGVYSSVYGCTETMGMTLSAQFSLPLRRGEITAPYLGTAVEIVNDDGVPIIGEMGHVVLSKSIPGLLLGILGDEDGSVKKKKYFSRFPGKFEIGDFGIINPITKGWYICGRSDATLKQGCRFGSSEIYRVVDKFPEVHDALCVSKYNQQLQVSAVLFLKMADGHSFCPDLVRRIREAIATELTTLHVPEFILETQDIPYNINGKKMEIIVKNIINKRPYNASSVMNEDSLRYFIDRQELKEI